ncbi:glycoside hydrolase family 78 protein [Siansivirga zeaxanthinifaciens]|uniref:Uncharacterized protein n=1 Tax=Siansivirga zeaxanthinifaciens CC-SAMT-1 TaxID=1454006 RepID=A0A0C5W0V7_9FLAO|nr:hypothetical protein AW14_13510 [Siansivirga zeaxanthinifaciens CC-SAMT-1]
MIKYILNIVILNTICSISVALAQQSLPAPISLSVSEGFHNPIGFYDSKPTFTWQLSQASNIKNKTAYEIVVASRPELLLKSPDV